MSNESIGFLVMAVFVAVCMTVRFVCVYRRNKKKYPRPPRFLNVQMLQTKRKADTEPIVTFRRY